MGLALWVTLASGLPLLSYLYIRFNDAKLQRLPPEATAISPNRWTDEDITRTAQELSGTPVSLLQGKLPPRTGRRYIVVGGAGFLGGWVVLHLLQRGEDPRRIRVLDVRLPARKDLQEGSAREVDFVQVDITDADAVDAAFGKPWPPASADDMPGEADPEITVFHTAATIRFYERHPSLLHYSERVNVQGTRNIVNVARKHGVSTLVYTSSGSTTVWSTRFLLWPWEKEPQHFVQSIVDDDDRIPTRHEDFFSNYAVSKRTGELLVRAANGLPSGHGVLRTGCIRPGNGIYGPGGDLLCGLYLVKKQCPSWIGTILQSFVYVENVSLAHLCYEQRLIELQGEGQTEHPDIGGQAFCVADGGLPPTYNDVYKALTLLTKGECHFIPLSPTFMYFVSCAFEAYYLFRDAVLTSSFSVLARLIPPLGGDLVLLQPSLFNLTSVHLIFDDSRARAPPEKGGLGYTPGCTTLGGVCKLVEEHQKGHKAKGWDSSIEAKLKLHTGQA